jgi:hypothetical protein
LPLRFEMGVNHVEWAQGESGIVWWLGLMDGMLTGSIARFHKKMEIRDEETKVFSSYASAELF